MSTTGIRVERLTHSFEFDSGETLVVLRDLNFSLQQAESIAILGPSGCGKTTLLRLMAGLAAASSGTILIEGKAPKPGSCAVIFQNNNCFPWLSIYENVAFGMHGAADGGLVISALFAMGLSDYKDALPSEISGGMQQKVGLARLMIAPRSVWLLDEPFNALDPFGRKEVRSLIYRSARKNGRTVVLVTHDVEEALECADRIIMFSGRPATVRYSVRDIAKIRSDHTTLTACQHWLESIYSPRMAEPKVPLELRPFCELAA